MAFMDWMLLILKIVGVVIGGHIAVTKFLPLMKTALSSFIKKEEFVTSVISVLMLYILVLVLNVVVGFLVSVENKYLGYLNVLLPGMEVILKVAPYIIYFLIAAVIVAGLSPLQPASPKK